MELEQALKIIKLVCDNFRGTKSEHKEIQKALVAIEQVLKLSQHGVASAPTESVSAENG